MAKKVIAFIDGFNLYHALDDKKSYHKYKWLNLVKLSKCFLPKDSNLVKVYYFTSLATWNNEKKDRHNVYIEALKSEGVEIILGRFQSVKKFCTNCKSNFKTFEEKKTDVNIATHLLKLAATGEYDEALIISGDSDLKPAIIATKELYSKFIRVAIPIGRKAEELKESSSEYSKMKEIHVKSSLFPLRVTLKNGITIECPSLWREENSPTTHEDISKKIPNPFSLTHH